MKNISIRPVTILLTVEKKALDGHMSLVPAEVIGK